MFRVTWRPDLNREPTDYLADQTEMVRVGDQYSDYELRLWIVVNGVKISEPLVIPFSEIQHTFLPFFEAAESPPGGHRAVTSAGRTAGSVEYKPTLESDE